jgi:malate dehydrogenase
MAHAVVLGASGGIGQPLSLLLKTNPLIKKLSLYDIVNTPGVASDLSHISTPAHVVGYLPPDDGLKKALTGADIVVIPAGIPRKPGMTREDLFKINAGIVRDLATGIATTAPKAFVLVISNPVNSTVPIVAEVFKKHGVYDPKRLFGVTTLDVVRASTFVAEANGTPEASPTTTVPVLGGHSGITILPILSQSQPPLGPNADIAALTKRIQFGGDEVVKAKDGTGSATLSMAYAGAEFANWILKAAKGQSKKTQTYIDLSAAEGGAKVKDQVGGLEFFSVTVTLGPNGVEDIDSDLGLNEYEKGLLKEAIPQLKENISTGTSFVGGPKL